MIRNNIKIDTKSRFWPKEPTHLLDALIKFESVGRSGIEVRVTRIKEINGKGNMSSVKIWKIPPISPLPPSDQNYEGNSPESNGDIKNIGGIISPSDRISPSKDTENRAENRSNGDNGGIGDIFRTNRGGTNNISIGRIQYQYSCYFCANTGKKSETNDKSEYLKHIGLSINKPAFPIKTELKKYGLTPQGKPWEI